MYVSMLLFIGLSFSEEVRRISLFKEGFIAVRGKVRPDRAFGSRHTARRSVYGMYALISCFIGLSFSGGMRGTTLFKEGSPAQKLRELLQLSYDTAAEIDVNEINEHEQHHGN